MPKMEVEYRLHKDAAYDERRQSLIDAIDKIAYGTFDLMTSSIVFEFVGNTDQLAAYLGATAWIYRDGRDKVIIKEVVIRNWTSIGLTPDEQHQLNAITKPTIVFGENATGYLGNTPNYDRRKGAFALLTQKR